MSILTVFALYLDHNIYKKLKILFLKKKKTLKFLHQANCILIQ